MASSWRAEEVSAGSVERERNPEVWRARMTENSSLRRAMHTGRAEETSAVDIGRESGVNYSCKREDRGGCPAAI